MRKILLSAAAAALIGSPAVAADMPVKGYAPPPVVYSWTGCYVGGNGGGLWVRKDFSSNVSATQAAVANIPLAAGSIDLGSHDASSGIGGFQVGCNYQAGGWVFGIQGDYDWASAKGRHALPGVLLSFLEGRSTTKSLASVTGRIGYAWDRFLGYVKGGGAWERDDYDVWIPDARSRVELTGAETRGGWTVGVGGEYAFTDWLTGFAEYDYYDFGTRAVTFTSPLVAGFNIPVDIRERKSVFKVGINFKFGGSAVTARY